MLRSVVAAAGMVRDYAVGLRPSIAEVVPCEAFGKDIVWIEEHAFRAGAHHVVYEGDEAVDVFLLVDHVLNHRMHLAVGQRIELQREGVAAVAVGAVVLAEDGAVGAEPIASPNVAQLPAAVDVGIVDRLFGRACLEKPFAGAPVVAVVAFPALAPPQLDHAHSPGFAAAEEVVGT